MTRQKKSRTLRVARQTKIRRIFSMKHTNKMPHLGQVLIDKSTFGRLTPWKIYKQISQFLAKSMADNPEQFSKNKIALVESCSSMLGFLECKKDETHPKKLEMANFCKDRLCDGCQNRRALRGFAVTTKILHVIRDQHPGYQYIFLTLTVPNVQLSQLNQEIDLMFEGWGRLVKRTEIRKVIKGYLRSLEVTYNHERDDFHPHFHVLIAVSGKYFKGKDYIKFERWQQLWKEARRLDVNPSVDVRKVKANLTEEEKAAGIDAITKACAEVCKYSLKSWSTKARVSSARLEKMGKDLEYGMEGHIWLRGTPEETSKVVGELHSIMKGRRLMQYGGLMREVKRDLNLKDGEEDDADLINVNDESTTCKCAVCDSDMDTKRYWWNKLARNYLRDNGYSG